MISGNQVADELKIAAGVAGTGFSFAGLTASELAGVCTALFMLVSIVEKLWKMYRTRKQDGSKTTDSGRASDD